MNRHRMSSYDHTAAEAAANIRALPIEMTEKIAKYLDNQSLVALHSTSKQLYAHTERIFTHRLLRSVAILSHPIGFSMLTELSHSPERANKVESIRIWTEPLNGREDEYGVAALVQSTVQEDWFSFFELLEALKKFPNLKVLAVQDPEYVRFNSCTFSDDQTLPFGHNQVRRMTGLEVRSPPEDFGAFLPYHVAHRIMLMDVAALVVKQNSNIQLHVAVELYWKGNYWNEVYRTQWKTWAPYIHQFSWQLPTKRVTEPLVDMDPVILEIVNDHGFYRPGYRLFELPGGNNATTFLRLKELYLFQVHMSISQFALLLSRTQIHAAELSRVWLGNPDGLYFSDGIELWGGLFEMMLANDTLRYLSLSELAYHPIPDDIEFYTPYYAINDSSPWTHRAQIECGLRSLIAMLQLHNIPNLPSRFWVDFRGVQLDVARLDIAEDAEG